MVSALVFGRVSDRLGRKTMYLIDLIGFVVFAALAAFSQNVWELILFRFLLGLWRGFTFTHWLRLVVEPQDPVPTGGS